METPISEVADRFSILRLKSERTSLDIKDEIAIYLTALDRYHDIGKYVNKLYEINGKIWDLEADLRKGKESKLGLEEIGRRAIAIRDLNNVRVGIKNEIVAEYSQGFAEKKINHASETVACPIR